METCTSEKSIDKHEIMAGKKKMEFFCTLLITLSKCTMYTPLISFKGQMSLKNSMYLFLISDLLHRIGLLTALLKILVKTE